MRSMRVHELSEDISVLRLDEVELPPPGKGEIRLRLKACSINFPDILMVQGKYQFKPELPFAPGMEGAGLVASVGEGVTKFKPGDRVVAGLRIGGFAEEVNISAEACRPIPGNMDFAKAAAYPAAYLTAYVALVCRGHLQKGETLLVHGSTGGVGLAAVEMGKLLGATVIATSASDEKLKVVKQRGADHVLNVTKGFREQVKELTGGRGADVIYDPVGGDVFDESTRCIAWNGRLLVIGFTSGRIPTVSVNMPLIKGFSVVGVRAGEYGRRDPEAGRANIEAVDRLAAEGKIDPHICARFPLERAVEAMRLLQNREAVGKVVLEM
ncbi:Alcohol dehydrogenase zinc-binding domain protein [Parvibaculum lavamentivorans DS-1]|uniref:Alcohol dehydrogenase zinc-binding domain protein n=1 Tax=Parvibaculum lavamentivorans (strain DS-1 / DSM 13023 / NCIMB 13966) TaxID=402881 RepID=A7HQ89_PARL1|nr:NADPH:quinone oxidoreductase family protein [Parvibaculum lavamentivorans]ABS62072.1 Alcohol dehydrogenase zinc-binding domain protein [Parvibaculum lavamentivorans DS-1]